MHSYYTRVEAQPTVLPDFLFNNRVTAARTTGFLCPSGPRSDQLHPPVSELMAAPFPDSITRDHTALLSPRTLNILRVLFRLFDVWLQAAFWSVVASPGQSCS